MFLNLETSLQRFHQTISVEESMKQNIRAMMASLGTLAMLSGASVAQAQTFNIVDEGDFGASHNNYPPSNATDGNTDFGEEATNESTTLKFVLGLALREAGLKSGTEATAAVTLIK